MPRPLTKEQEVFLAKINSPERRAEAARNQKAHEEAMAAAKAEADRLYAIVRERYEREKLASEEAVRPLKEALAAAGIKLEFDGYHEGAWMRYQIGEGPIVEVEEGLSAFEED